MDELMLLILFALVAYLIGSIPFGYLLVKRSGGGDIRKTGSGGTGATNAMRAGGKWVALATLLLDAGKGIFAVYLSYRYCESIVDYGLIEGSLEKTYFLSWFIYAAAYIFVILGHMYPVWLKWKGGKGFATFIGVSIAYSEFLGDLSVLVLLSTWIVIFLATRISSLSAIIGIVITNIYLIPFTTLLGFIYPATSLLVIFAHRDNIRRLLKGEEHRFSFGAKK